MREVVTNVAGNVAVYWPIYIVLVLVCFFIIVPRVQTAWDSWRGTDQP